MKPKAPSYHPKVNFYFRVHFSLTPDSMMDVGFQSVTGLDSTIETEPINEGGVNQFAHMVPTRKKRGPITLKRGLLSPSQSALTKYIKSCFDNQTIVPMGTVIIQLLGEKGDVLLLWTATNVWPLSWKMGELSAMQGDVLIETLELTYNQLIFEEPSS